MTKNFSKVWIGSKQPRKQRKYRYNAPIHIKRKFINVHLSSELRTKHNTRSIGLKTQDKVKILRGQFRGKTGKVERIDVKRSKIFITGIENIKKDGSKALYPINPSNLMIMELNLNDKVRQKTLDRKKTGK